MQQSPSSRPRHTSGTLPVRSTRTQELVPPVAQTAPEALVEARLDAMFLDTLRANVHASARHAALGHTGPSFRECSGAACREAAKLLPDLDPGQGSATDAEMLAILAEVLTSLEREGTPFLAPEPS